MNLGIDIFELAQLITPLDEFIKIMGLATPEGRWRAFQAWKNKNPEHAKQVDKWIYGTTDEAYMILQDWFAKKMDMPVAMLKIVIAKEVEAKIKPAIKRWQTDFQEREKADSRKEIAG